MANRLAKSYVLRITPKEGEAFTYATHLGSSLSIARDIAVEQLNAGRAGRACPKRRAHARWACRRHVRRPLAISCPIRPGAVELTRHERKDAMDLSTLTYGAPATEPAPIEPIRVDGMAYAKIIDGMMNVGFFRERPTADGGSERVIVAKLVFPADPSTVTRALVVTQSGLDGAMREQAERERQARPKPRVTPLVTPMRSPSLRRHWAGRAPL